MADDKWLARLAAAVQGELDRVSQTLSARVDEHLKKMGIEFDGIRKQAGDRPCAR